MLKAVRKKLNEDTFEKRLFHNREQIKGKQMIIKKQKTKNKK